MRKINPKAKPISEAKLAELVENANLILADARRYLLNEQPFVGSIIMNLDIQPVRDYRVPTACTDGKKIFFDIDFLSSLSPEHQQFVLAHEVWHCALAHFMREEGREHELFNIAEDLEVNQLLALDGFNVPSMALMPKKFRFPDGLNAEEYYELLIKNKNSMPTGMPMSGEGGASGSGNDDDSDGKINGSGNSNGKIDGQFDVHITINDSIYGCECPDDIADKYGKVGIDPNFNPEVSESQVGKMREICVAAAQIAEKSEKYKGSLPAFIQRFVDKLMTPNVKWQDVLSAFVTRTIEGKTTWNRPNRRFVSSKIYLPSNEGETIKVGVVIDTSGSTAGDIPKFLGELNSLVKTFSGYTLNIVQCDAKVHSCDTYDETNPLDLENTGMNINGGGGTEMRPALKYIAENSDDIECDCICVLTDGYIDEIKTNPTGLPVLWLLTESGYDVDSFKKLVRFGEVIKMKN